MTTLINILLDLFCDTHLHHKWISDIVISECITLNFTEINDCSTISINKEIHRLINLYTNVIQHNNVILYISTNKRLMTVVNKKMKLWFYYITTKDEPSPKMSRDDWNQSLTFNTIHRSSVQSVKKIGDVIKRDGDPTHTPSKDIEFHTFETPSKPPIHTQTDSHKKAKLEAGLFWESTEMMNLFPSPNNLRSADLTLIEEIDRLDKDIHNPKLLKMMTFPLAPDYPLTPFQTLIMSQRCTVLRTCYANELEFMEKLQNWGEVIRISIKQLQAIGIKRYKHIETVRNMHRKYRNKHAFPHPNKMVQQGKRLAPPIFRTYPDSEEMFKIWFSEHLSSLSCESVSYYVKNELIPTIYKIHKEEFQKIPQFHPPKKYS